MNIKYKNEAGIGFMSEAALITGASSGIGYQLAKVFAKHNHNLVLVARSHDKLVNFKKKLEKKYSVKVFIIVSDLSVSEAPLRIYNKLNEQNIKISILVNNAGFGDLGLFTKRPWNRHEKIINLNVTALSRLTHLFLKDMVSRGNGRIMNVASTTAFHTGSLMSVYSGTKAYILSFSEALSSDYEGTGVTITCLCPGLTASGFQKAAGIENIGKRKMASSRSVAEYGYKSMMQGRGTVIFGFMNFFVIFLMKFLPRSMVRSFSRRLHEK